MGKMGYLSEEERCWVTESQNIDWCDELFGFDADRGKLCHDHIGDMAKGPEAVREGAYRRGCHQAIHLALKLYKSTPDKKHYRKKLEKLLWVLFEMRHDGNDYKSYLREAERRVKGHAKCEFYERFKEVEDGRRINRKGFVYFLLDEQNNAVKIGFSSNPKKRKYDVETGSIFNRVLLGYIPGDEDLEWKLQNRFDHYWIIREWYRYEGELRVFIEDKLKIGKDGAK